MFDIVVEVSLDRALAGTPKPTDQQTQQGIEMSTRKTSVRRRSPHKTASALFIPLAVLASIPERLRVLAETIKICAAHTDAGYDQFRVHYFLPVRDAFESANGAANQAVNAFAVLETLAVSKSEKGAVEAALEAQALTTAIYKASGNIHNDSLFKATFSDASTTDATVKALYDCADKIRAAVAPFGYN